MDVRLLLLPFACATLVAQGSYTATWVAESPMLLEVGEQPDNLDRRDTLPAGTVLAWGLSRWIETRLHNLANAELRALWTLRPDRTLRAELVESAAADEVFQFPFYHRGYAQIGAHGTRLRIVPGADTFALIRIAHVTDFGAGDGTREAQSDVDIGGDGSFEFHAVHGQDRTIEFRRPIPSAGLDIVTRTSVHVAAAQSGQEYTEAQESLVIEVLPAAIARFTHYGVGYGLGLEGSDAFRGPIRDLVLTATGPAGAVAALAFGAQRAQVPIPGTNCTLWNDSLITSSFQFDFAGQATMVYSIPWDLDLLVDVQGFAIDPVVPQLLCSDGLEIDAIR